MKLGLRPFLLKGYVLVYREPAKYCAGFSGTSRSLHRCPRPIHSLCPPRAALDIKPISRGGETIYENLQVLCDQCSTSRSDEDDSDFRPGADEGFNNDCIFCAASKGNKLIENDYAFAIPDKYPITEGHTLIIPQRHFASYFDSIQAEHDAIYELLKVREKQLLENDPLITGFDIGVNVGEVVGQKILHCHIHLIPRKKGTLPNGGRGANPSNKELHAEIVRCKG